MEDRILNAETAQMVNPKSLEEVPKFVIPDPTEYLNQFVFLLYFVNPVKDNVRIILDDGTIKFYMKRDKFLKIMEDLLNETLLKECQYTLFRIKESLNVYGGIFHYDRKENIFKQVTERVDLSKINPQELLVETRKSLVKEALTENFKQVHKEYQDNVLDKIKFSSVKNNFNKFMTIITSLNEKKKKPML